MIRFLLRFLGVTGLLIAGLALIGLAGEPGGLSLKGISSSWKGQGSTVSAASAYALVFGVATALLVVVLELLSGTRTMAGRRSALGTNAAVQVILMAILVVGLNIWSFRHYRRWDCTREGNFTIKPEVASELRKLRSETTVVVYLQHRTFGRFSDKPPDEYDSAAEGKVVEKANDLVNLLREFGPQFRVVMLDVKEKGFSRLLDEESARHPGLREAVTVAEENSIFFCAGRNIQRLGFHEFYQLDKTESAKANKGRGNLVLNYQGIEPFARRVLAIEEKKPRVAIAVAHPWLSTEGQVDEYTLAGLRKSLTNYGFDVRDILLNKLTGRRGRGFRLEKSALSIEESRFERVEAQLTAIRLQFLQSREELADGKEMLALLQANHPQEELDRRLSVKYGRRVTMPVDTQKRLLTMLPERIPGVEQEIAKKEKKERELETELETLQTQERVSEGQRQTDLRKKFTALLSDCDALIVPRMTLIDTSIGDVVPNSLHQLDENQLAAIKDFMKAGKPVLFCFGPPIEAPDPSDTPDRRPTPPSDNLESVLNEVGFVFAPQAVLFDDEAEAYAMNQVLSFGRGGGVEEVPPLEFPEAEVPISSLPALTGPSGINPLARSLRIIERSAGLPLSLKLRYTRPVYYQSLRHKPAQAVSFLMTSKASWNEDQPYPTDDRPIPRFEAPKPDDPTRGTRFERRRGPFPVGVAVETTLPGSWYDERIGALKAATLVGSSYQVAAGFPAGLAAESLWPAEEFAERGAIKPAAEAKKARLAVIGHGGCFSGASLAPANELVLLQSMNWLLGRDDRLPRAGVAWQYPRAELTEREKFLWHWGVFAGLPMIFAYLGFVVLLRRRIR